MNFSKEIFENYFGATCGENGVYRVLLKSINSSGIMGIQKLGQAFLYQVITIDLNWMQQRESTIQRAGKGQSGYSQKYLSEIFYMSLLCPGMQGTIP